jgi:hypothetical protein
MANQRSPDLESQCEATGGPETKKGFAPGERADTRIGREMVIREGMEVMGSNGEYVGEVKEIREQDFLVDRRMARDVYVPFSAVAKSDRCIMLNVPSDKMDDADWERAPVMGTREDRNVFPD